jgi:hypothetical protein
LRSLSEGGRWGSRIEKGLGTFEEPFSAHRYRDIQRELSHGTLAQRVQCGFAATVQRISNRYRERTHRGTDHTRSLSRRSRSTPMRQIRNCTSIHSPRRCPLRRTPQRRSRTLLRPNRRPRSVLRRAGTPAVPRALAPGTAPVRRC